MSVALIWISFSRVDNRKFSCSLIHQWDWSANIKTASFMSAASLVICEVLIESIQRLKTTRPNSWRSMISQIKGGKKSNPNFKKPHEIEKKKIWTRWGYASLVISPCFLRLQDSKCWELLPESIERMKIPSSFYARILEDRSYSIG